MFSFEIRVNGSLITHIYGHNEDKSTSDGTLYTYEHYRVASRKLVCGTVTHHPSDGIDTLVIKIMEDVREQEN